MIRSLSKLFPGSLRLLINLWPPFLGAGIRVTRLDPTWKVMEVEMKLRRWNRNYVGTHYGGSLYSMTDPFFMLMLIENLGKDYIVWDKAATVRFRKPGIGTVFSSFQLLDEQLDEIRHALKSEAKIERTFQVEVKDETGALVADVQKQIHIRRKG